MEPAEGKVAYVIRSQVVQVVERFSNFWSGGTGSDACFVKKSIGWFLHLEGSWELLYVGETKPNLAPGDRIKITIQKVS